MSKIVYVDVDDTLANTREAIVQYYRRFTGDCSTNAHMKTGVKYDLLCPKWTGERMREAFMDPFFFNFLSPLPGAKEAMCYLIDSGYDVKICTAHRKEGEAIKRHWIQNYFPMIKDIIVTEPFVPKDDYIGYAFIDDGIHNLINNGSEIKVLFDIYHILDYNNHAIKILHNWGQIKGVL